MRESYEVKPSNSSFVVRLSAWSEMQAGKPWSQPWIQATVSGSATFLAGEAGMGCTEGVVLVSTTMLDLNVRLRSLRERRAEIEKPQRKKS
jgi:hypothetical protein